MGGRDLIGLGSLLLAALVAGMLLGWFIDDRLGTEPVFILVGIFGGIIAGAIGSWVWVRGAMRG